MKTILRGYFGHHKCASSWINGILQGFLLDTGYIYKQVFRSKDFEKDFNKYIYDNNIDFISYTNANYACVKTIDVYKGFHVIRDPRDMAVSGYFSHLNSHPTDDWPELIPHREALKKLTIEEGLIMEFEFSRQFYEHMYDWNYEQSNILEYKMEEFTKDPFNNFIEVLDFMGLVDLDEFTTKKRIKDLLIILSNKMYRNYQKYGSFHLKYKTIPAEKLFGKIFNHRYSKLSGGRTKGKEDVKKHYRKGVPGDWKNYFTGEHREYFKKEYNDLLLKLRYEKGSNW